MTSSTVILKQWGMMYAVWDKLVQTVDNEMLKWQIKWKICMCLDTCWAAGGIKLIVTRMPRCQKAAWLWTDTLLIPDSLRSSGLGLKLSWPCCYVVFDASYKIMNVEYKLWKCQNVRSMNGNDAAHWNEMIITLCSKEFGPCLCWRLMYWESLAKQNPRVGGINWTR